MTAKTFNIFLAGTLCLFAVACGDLLDSNKHSPPDNHEKVTITQGVWGNVWFWEGNFMPSTDGSSHGTITPVIREIDVHTATPFDSVVGKGIFFDSILTKLVAKLQSDNTGFFQIQLPPGNYSFFVKEDSLYYANEVNSDGCFVSATVTANSVTKRQIDITYKAAY